MPWPRFGTGRSARIAHRKIFPSVSGKPHESTQLASEVDNARKYAQLCLDITPEEDPFYLGYAQEAIARAEGLAGDADAAGKHLETATQLAATIPDPEHRKMLEADLESLA